jgi:peptidoglycan/xylan/chitin deacetylase (PgdA/CDA1 family)
MDWDDLKNIEDVFEIGGHTITHPILTNISIEEAGKEILASQVELEKKLGHSIASFAYPNGNYNESLMKVVQESGFKNSVTYEQGNNNSSTNNYALFRRGINYNDNLDIFKAKIGGLF